MMAAKSFVFRFADIEVREREFSLTRAGEVLPVEPKAFRVLLMLLRNPQKLITKEELLNAVWGDVAVGDNSLSRSVALLRRVLGDDSREPSYIATVQTVGYRFICKVEVVEDHVAEVEVPAQGPTGNSGETLPSLEPLPHSPNPPIPKGPKRLRSAVLMAAALIALAWVTQLIWRHMTAVPVIDGALQLTDDGYPKLNDYNNSGVVSDGSRIYFNEMLGGRMVIAQVAATGGQTGQIATTIPDPEVHALAPDSSSLLIVSTDPSCCHLWTVPLPAGEPRKLLDVPDLRGADFSSDGHIFYTSPKSLYVADKDGSNPRRLFDFADWATYPVVSPDRKRIRLKVGGSLWELNSDGSGAHALRDWQSKSDACCGRWTSDGRYFVYQSRQEGRTDLWALPERSRWFGRPTSPLRLTNGPISYVLPSPSPDGKHIFAIGLRERGELVRYDRNSQQFVPYLSGISAMDATVSRDGIWVTYMSYPNRNLWRSRLDGSERLQLTYPPVAVMYPRISPDGTKVAFGAVDANGIECAYVLPLAGGTPRKLADHAVEASWSPNGSSLLIGPDDDFALGLRTIDLRTGKIDSVPGSAGRGAAIWPSEDTFVALEPEAGERLVTFDIKTQRWSDFVKGPLVHWMQSLDGNYLYYMTGGDDPKVMRIRFSDHEVEEVASLKNFRPAEDEDFGTWLGVAPDGSPLLTRDIGTQEIYSLSVHWP
jgi:DNA-binding winged helix-turn-helix (wHTH) protein